LIMEQEESEKNHTIRKFSKGKKKSSNPTIRKNKHRFQL
jgi:hypothetical protein